MITKCPKCQSNDIILSGKVKEKQRYKCKACNFFFSKGIKPEPIQIKKADKIYKDYLQNNWSNYILAKVHGLKPAQLQRWFKVSFWAKKEASENRFKRVAYHAELTSDITNYLKPLQPKIRVKPQFSNVVIQYLYLGHKTNPKFTSVLFTLYDFRELYGESFCTVKFNFLATSKNRLAKDDTKIHLQDFLPEHYSTSTHLREETSIVRNIKVSDFLDEIMSNDKTLFYLNLFMEQKNEDIKRQIQRLEELESNRKKEIAEKIRKIRERRNKV